MFRHLYGKGIKYSTGFQWYIDFVDVKKTGTTFYESFRLKTHTNVFYQVNRCKKTCCPMFIVYYSQTQLSFYVYINHLFHFKQKPLIKTSKTRYHSFGYTWGTSNT